MSTMRKIFTFVAASVFGIGLLTGFADACDFCWTDGPGQPIHCASFPGKCPVMPAQAQ
jgi:hypothetical protein